MTTCDVPTCADPTSSYTTLGDVFVQTFMPDLDWNSMTLAFYCSACKLCGDQCDTAICRPCWEWLPAGRYAGDPRYIPEFLCYAPLL